MFVLNFTLIDWLILAILAYSVVVSAIRGFVREVIGLAAVLGALPLGYWTELGPGPGFFPLWLGVLLAGLGAGWLLMELRAWRARRAGVPVALPAGEDEEVPAYSLPTAVAIVVSLCILAASLEVVGYQLSMLVFLLFHLLVLGRRGPLESAVISLVGSFGVFVIFTRLLTVALPASSIPFLRDLGL
jgi:putative tricarboxylic transport membrane protein